MKKFCFTDSEKYNNHYDTVFIKAEDEDDAWVELTQRHSNMGKGFISIDNAKKRYKLNKEV